MRFNCMNRQMFLSFQLWLKTTHSHGMIFSFDSSFPEYNNKIHYIQITCVLHTCITHPVLFHFQPIHVHEMPNISFASGGDTDTLDFVAYVAKDRAGVRSCFVLECGGGIAQDVITTVGQAFELR